MICEDSSQGLICGWKIINELPWLFNTLKDKEKKKKNNYKYVSIMMC